MLLTEFYSDRPLLSWQQNSRQNGLYLGLYNKYKCTKHQFIQLLTATFKDLHIENSKNYKR